MNRPSPFGTILGERTLVPADGGRGRLVVSLGIPRPTPGHDDWGCPFRIKGLGIDRVEYAYGIDSLQALTNAFEGIRYVLDRLERPVTLEGASPPETAFSRFIPLGLGPLTRRLEKMVDREIVRSVKALKRRHELREKRGRPKRTRDSDATAVRPRLIGGPTSSRTADRRNRPGRGR